MDLDPDSDSDPDPDPDPNLALFVTDHPDANKKLIFAYYFLKIHLHHFQRSKVKKNHKAVGIKIVLFLLGDKRIWIRIHTYVKRIRIRIQEAQKHVDPVDPDSDPQHLFKVYRIKLDSPDT
jgi:hypothetical protein